MPNIVKARLIQEVEPEVELKPLSMEDDDYENIAGSQGKTDNLQKTGIQGKPNTWQLKKPNEEFDNLIRVGMKKVEDIIRNAENKAEQIMVNARRESGLLQQQSQELGYREGFDKGYSKGMQKSKVELQGALDEVLKIADAIIEEKTTMFQRQEPEILKISLEVAKKIMRQQVEVNKDAIPKMIEEIIKENEKPVKVYISEYNKTLQFIVDKEMYCKIKELSDNLRVIVIKDDEQDECFQDILKVETEYGMVEANIGRQLESLKNTLDI